MEHFSVLLHTKPLCLLCYTYITPSLLLLLPPPSLLLLPPPSLLLLYMLLCPGS
jgi:hypothetical protein